MSKPSRAKRKETEHYKLMQRTEKQVEARLKKEMNRFKDKDQFELEDHIIDLENKIRELNEIVRTYQARFEGGHDDPFAEFRPRPDEVYETGVGLAVQSNGDLFDSGSLSWTMPEQSPPVPEQAQGLQYVTSTTTYSSPYQAVDSRPADRASAQPTPRRGR